MVEYYGILKQSPLFRDIETSDMGTLLSCLNTNTEIYGEGEYIFFAGDKLNYVGIVLEGMVEIVKENLAGNKHILDFLKEADMFGEVIVCTADRVSPVTVKSRCNSKVLWIPYSRVIRACEHDCGFHVKLIQNMMVILGEKNMILNKKIEMLVLKGMREKLASFLLREYENRGRASFKIQHNRTELADYLNVSRTSMSREITRMKDEGMLDYDGRSFLLKDIEGLRQCLE